MYTPHIASKPRGLGPSVWLAHFCEIPPAHLQVTFPSTLTPLLFGLLPHFSCGFVVFTKEMSAVNHFLYAAVLMCAVSVGVSLEVPRALPWGCGGVTFPPTTFQVPMLNETDGTLTMQSWLISPSFPTNVTPPGNTPCEYESYFARYDVGGAPQVCLTRECSTHTVSSMSDGGCWFNVHQGYGCHDLSLDLNVFAYCDPNAATPVVTPKNVSFVTNIFDGAPYGTTYSATVQSSLVCFVNPLLRIPKKPHH